MIINLDTLLSTFNDRGTLLKWLKKLEAALKGGTLVKIDTVQNDDNSFKLVLEFADGTSATSPDINLPQGTPGQPGQPGQPGEPGQPGQPGEPGASVASATVTGTRDDGTNTYTAVQFTLTNGQTVNVEIKAKNGKDGSGATYELTAAKLMDVLIGSPEIIIDETEEGGLVQARLDKQFKNSKADAKAMEISADVFTTITDKGTFYKEVSKLFVNQPTQKLYMHGTTAELQGFFNIWGLPLGFQATHAIIVIEPISNTSSRVVFNMYLTSSNYTNTQFQVVNGYNGSYVGTSGWIACNELSKVATKNYVTNITDGLNTAISGLQTSKQDTLTPGNNITIENNVISASGGGGGGGTKLYRHELTLGMNTPLPETLTFRLIVTARWLNAWPEEGLTKNWTGQRLGFCLGYDSTSGWAIKSYISIFGWIEDYSKDTSSAPITSQVPVICSTSEMQSEALYYLDPETRTYKKLDTNMEIVKDEVIEL